MPQYRVAKGKSVMLPNSREVGRYGNRVVREGEILPDGAFDEKRIKNKLERGVIVRVGGEHDIPVKESPVIHTGEILGDDDPLKVTSRDKGEGEGEGQTVGKTTGVWSFDPRTLQDKDLYELHVMIIEKDDTVDLDTIQDKEEAIDFLSQDFSPENE